MPHTPMGPGPEFDRIRTMAARWKERAAALGDDCAILAVGGDRIAVSIDLAVEGVHFRRDWLSPAEIGYRAAAAALSDLAAVAAEPMALLLSLGTPHDEPEATFAGIADGVGDAASDAGAVIVGGDTSRSEQLIIDCCVIGRASAAVGRRGARPGDLIVVTGALGGPLAALTAWLAGGQPPAETRSRFTHPAPRHAAARWLEAHRARAIIDISDGLTSDLGHLLAASGVGAHVAVEQIPIFGPARAAAESAGESAWRFAARSGEEYELLAALPPDVSAAELADAPVPLTVIGTIEAAPGLRATERGADVTLPVGHDHFR